MKEKTQQQFAKEKGRILDGDDSQLTYEMLRKTHYLRSVKWFADNVVSTTQKDRLFTQYSVYAEWCIRQNIMPLISTDFNCKVVLLFEGLKANTPTQEQLLKAADIWF